jgi:hypothetical protein
MQFVFGSLVTCVVTLVHHGLLPPLHFKLHVFLDKIQETVTKFMIFGVIIKKENSVALVCKQTIPTKQPLQRIPMTIFSVF